MPRFTTNCGGNLHHEENNQDVPHPEGHAGFDRSRCQGRGGPPAAAASRSPSGEMAKPFGCPWKPPTPCVKRRRPTASGNTKAEGQELNPEAGIREPDQDPEFNRIRLRRRLRWTGRSQRTQKSRLLNIQHSTFNPQPASH